MWKYTAARGRDNKRRAQHGQAGVAASTAFPDVPQTLDREPAMLIDGMMAHRFWLVSVLVLCTVSLWGAQQGRGSELKEKTGGRRYFHRRD